MRLCGVPVASTAHSPYLLFVLCVTIIIKQVAVFTVMYADRHFISACWKGQTKRSVNSFGQKFANSNTLHGTSKPSIFVAYSQRNLTGTIFTALHGMQTWSSDENSVCPSVSPSVSASVC